MVVPLCGSFLIFQAVVQENLKDDDDATAVRGGESLVLFSLFSSLLYNCTME